MEKNKLIFSNKFLTLDGEMRRTRTEFDTEPLSRLTFDKEMIKTADGFQNMVAKLGLQTENLLSAGTYQFNLLTRNRILLEKMYRGSWVVGKTIDAVADDMTTAGIQITTSEGAENIRELQVALKRLKIFDSLSNLVRWGDLYGGAVAVLQIEGQDMATPLNVDTISKGQFKGLAIYDRWQINPLLVEFITDGPDIGLPKYYQIISSSQNLTTATPEQDTTIAKNPTTIALGGIIVHHSRIIRKIGHILPFYQAITEMMWGESIIERIHDVLVSHDTATMSTANLVNKAYIRTVKVDGLREILAGGPDAQNGLYEFFENVRALQASEGLTIIDKEDEYHTESYSFAGLDKVLLTFSQQLSGSTGVPLVRLLGQSPAGLNATGESDIRMYYDKIKSKQEKDLGPGLEKILKCTYKSVFQKPLPTDLAFIFTPLWQMSATDKSKVAKENTETIVGAFDSGLIKRSTALKELRQNSTETGLFSNITDEDIDEAVEDEVNPLPPVEGAPAGFKPVAEKSEVEEPAVDPDKVADSIFKSLFRKRKK